MSFKNRILSKIGSQKPTPWGQPVGLDNKCISRIFKYNKIPKHEHLIRIATALNVSIDWLLTGKEPNKPKEPEKQQTDPYLAEIIQMLKEHPEDKKLILKLLKGKKDFKEAMESFNPEGLLNEG